MHFAFQSYIHDYWKPYPHQQEELSKWFQALLNRTFQGAPKKPDNFSPQAQPPKAALLCGLDAINHIMLNQGRMPIGRDLLDDLADNVASLEAMVCSDMPLTTPDAQGNYHITVMTIALKQLTDLCVEVWTPGKTFATHPTAYILGNGAHWQALVQESNNWHVRDKKSFIVNNLKNYLEVANRRGMVLALLKEPSRATGDIDWENSSQNRKRLHHQVDTPDSQPTPCITSSEAPIVIAEDDDDERARAYAKNSEDADPNTQHLLAELANTFATPPSGQPQIPPTPDAAQSSQNQWVPTKIGNFTMLHNEAANLYKCPFCGLERETHLGVATHMGRYCKAARKAKQEEVEEDEDII